MSLGNKQIMANNIKRLLEQHNLNGHRLALLLDFKYTTVNDWLNAKSYPRIDKIEKMANFFNVEKSDLVENKSDLNHRFKSENLEYIDTNHPHFDDMVKIHKGLTIDRHGVWIDYGKQLLDEQKQESEQS